MIPHTHLYRPAQAACQVFQTSAFLKKGHVKDLVRTRLPTAGVRRNDVIQETHK